MRKALSKLIKEEQGQGALEYGLIIGLVVVGLIFALNTLREELGELMTAVGEEVGEIGEGIQFAEGE